MSDQTSMIKKLLNIQDNDYLIHGK